MFIKGKVFINRKKKRKINGGKGETYPPSLRMFHIVTTLYYHKTTYELVNLWGEATYDRGLKFQIFFKRKVSCTEERKTRKNFTYIFSLKSLVTKELIGFKTSSYLMIVYQKHK